MLAVESAGTNEGFGWLIALLLAGTLAFLAINFHQQWLAKTNNPSPPPPGGARKSVSPAETDDPDTDDTNDPESWWGERIRLADGSTLVRRARAVWNTGSHWLPEDDEPDDQEDLDDELVEEEAGESREEMADRLIRIRCRYSDAVAEIMSAFDVSESTAKRAIARAQERAQRRG